MVGSGYRIGYEGMHALELQDGALITMNPTKDKN